MVQISLQNSGGKVVFYGWVPRNPPPWAPTGVNKQSKVLTSFLKTWSVLDYLTVVDRKLGDQRLTMMQLDQQYWKSKEVYPWTISRTQSEEINNSEEHFPERFKEVSSQVQIKENIEVTDNKRESLFVI